MNWDLEQDLHIDLSDTGATVLDVSANGLQDRSREIVWRVGDNFDLNIFLYDRTSTTPSTPVELPEDRYILLGAKLSTDGVVSGSALFGAASFEKATKNSKTCYRAAIPLDDPALASALSGKASIQVQVDLEFENGSNTRRITKSFNVTIKPESFANSYTPVPATPEYPSPEAIITTTDMNGVTIERDEVTGNRWLCADGVRILELVRP